MPINVTSPIVVAKTRQDNTDSDLASIRNKAGTPVVQAKEEHQIDVDNFKIVSKPSAFLRDMLAEKK